jgi:hypothetical protein
MIDYDAIAISWGWFQLKCGWYHPMAEQYHGWIGYPVCYSTSKELCETENLTEDRKSHLSITSHNGSQGE